MLSTIQKIRLDADRFMHKYGLENSETLRISRLAEDSERWLKEDETNEVMEELWNQIYSNAEHLAMTAE